MFNLSKFLFPVVIACSISASLPVSAEEITPTRLRQTNLLVFRHTGRATPSPVRSISDWRERRKEILRGMEQVMGPFPGDSKRCELDVKVEQETDRGSWFCRKLTYQSEPGSRVPAFLLIPKTAPDKKRMVTGILALHPTDMEFGNRVVVEQLRSGYRAYGRDLVERGFVVLAPAYPIMAGYEPDLKSLGYKSGTMKAIWDNCRGLDLLASLPFVSTNGFGAIGHSLGGHNAIFTSVFDSRIRAVVSSCGFDSFLDYKGGDIRGWTSSRYMPALLAYKDRLQEIPFDFPELLGALAPRPVFINAPLQDANFQHQSVDRAVRAAEDIYKVYGHPENIQVSHPDCGHDFPDPIRNQAYEFLAGALKQ
jgi:hypothetical protein